MEVTITYGSVGVRLGGVESYCAGTVHPDSPSGVQILEYIYAVPGTGRQVINPIPVNDNVAITSTVPVGTWLHELDSLVVLFTWTTRPTASFSAFDEALAIVVVPYGGLSPAMEPQLIRPPAIGSPTNPSIAALRATQLIFDNATIDALPAIIDVDAIELPAPQNWGSWNNARPLLSTYLDQFEGFCGELWYGWGTFYGTPALQHPGYGTVMGAYVGEALMMMLSTDDAGQRRELARRLTQWGVDLVGAFASGRVDVANGGHMQGRKALVVLSGHLLGMPWVDATGTLGAVFNEDDNFFVGSPAWVWGWPYGYRGHHDTVVTIQNAIATWPTSAGSSAYYLHNYMPQVCGVQIGTALAMRLLGLTAQMGVAHDGMIAQWMEGPAPADVAAMEAHYAPLGGIPWGKSHSDVGSEHFGKAAWAAYSDYSEPAVTVVTYDHSAHPSVRYAATVEGAPLPLFGRTTDAQFTSPYWSAGASIDQSGATVATDGDVEIVVSLISGSVTSMKVYTRAPGGPVIPCTVAGGTGTFTLPYDTIAWCEVNGLRGQPLIVHSKPIIEQPTGGTVDIYDGSQTTAVAGRTLVFEAGTHTIGQSFEVPAGARVWLHGEAWVIGSFKLLGTTGADPIAGHGILSGEWGAAIRAYIRSLPYETMVTYSLIHGPFGVLDDRKVSGITLLDPPFYSTSHGANVYERVTIIAPWWGNANAFFLAEKAPERTASVSKCCAFAHDDIFDMGEYYGPHAFDDNVVGSIASASFIVSYWPSADSGTTHVAERNTVVCLNYAIESGGSIVLSWCDGSDPAEVVNGIVIDGCDFMGSVIYGRPFDFRNKLYPTEWGPLQELGLGQIQNITLRNITFETVPLNKSYIKGLDANNHPRNFVLENIWYAGTRLTAGNFLDYFEIDWFVTNITVDGVRVDRIDTTGAAAVQLGAAGTSGLVVGASGSVAVPIGAAGSSGLLIAASGQATVWVRAGGASELGAVVPERPTVAMNVARGPGVAPGRRLRRGGWWIWRPTT